MRCTYCGKEINSNDLIVEDENYFCNKLCKYLYEKGETESERTRPQTTHIIPDDLLFPVSLPNFVVNEIVVKGSLLWKAKLLKNGVKIKPSKGNAFAKKLVYNIEDDYGDMNTFELQNRFLDAVPILKVNDKKVILAPSLKWYEYLWIAIPLIILFTGGALGGAIGAVAVYVNSLIFRKFSSKVGKYILSGINSFIALFIFFRVITFLYPAYLELEFNKLQGQNKRYTDGLNESQKAKFEILTDNGWVFAARYDMQGNNTTPAPANNVLRNSKRYFFKDGDYQQIFYDGSILTGKWSFTSGYDSLKLESSTEKFTVKLSELSPDNLSYEISDAIFLHRPYTFSIEDLF